MKLNVYMDDIREVPDHLNDFWIPIRKVEDVIYLLKMGVVDNMSLDHDMGWDGLIGKERMSGYDLLCYMEENNLWPDGEIMVHSANPVGRDKMKAALERAGR